jgi:hypothetical protein
MPRLVVLFFGSPLHGRVNLPPKMLLRSSIPVSPDDLLTQCRPPDTYDPAKGGKVLIGRENEPHIVNFDDKHPSVIEWQGPYKSGDFHAFLRKHIARFFPATIAT